MSLPDILILPVVIYELSIVVVPPGLLITNPDSVSMSAVSIVKLVSPVSKFIFLD